GSAPYALTAANGVLFFVADDGVHGAELYVTDGTNATRSVTVTPSVANPVSGQPVSLSAAVGADVGTPTGTVTFQDGSAVLGTSNLVGGTATLTLAAPLGAGAHTLVATYGGDANFAAVASAGLPLTIQQAPTAVTLTASRTVASAGQPVVLAAT